MKPAVESQHDDEKQGSRALLLRWALVLGAAAFVAITVVESGTALKAGSVGPPLALVTLDGEQVDLRAYADNKPLLLNFFATWCAPCKEEVPELNRAHETNGDVRIAGVLIDASGNIADVRAQLARMNIRYPVWITDDITQERWHVEAVPTSYLMDQRGVIRWSANGGVDADTVARAVRRIQ